MTDQELYTLNYEYGSTSVTMRLGMGLSIDEMAEQFENFLLAAGYRMPDGLHIGLVGDDTSEPATDKYLGGLFDDNSSNHFRFDGSHTSWMDDLGGVTAPGTK